MKKSIIVCMFFMATMSIAKAQNVCEEIELQVELIDPSIPHTPVGRSPVLFPSVSLEGHTLYFGTSCDGYTLCLLDENGEEAYSTVIPNNTISLTLPSQLSGQYKILIIQNNLCFFGYITL